MKIRARTVTKLPATLTASGGLQVVKSAGVWTFSPDWSVLTPETTIPDPASRELWIRHSQTGVYTRLSVQALIDNLPAGPSGDDGSLIFVQNSAPSTSTPEGSIWVDADSSDLDLYQLVSSVWTDTGSNLKGIQGDAGESPEVFVQNSAPSTSGVPEGSLWIDADSSQNDLYQLQSGSWVDTGVNLKGQDGAGTGDMIGANNLAVGAGGVANAATAFANIKQAATTSATGVSELATDAEAQAKSDTARVITPSNLAALGASATFAGLVELATDAETQTGTDTARAITPANLTAKEATSSQYRGNTSDRILTTDQVWSAAAEVTLTDAATIAVDFSTFINGVVTLAGNRALGNPTNEKVGQCGYIRIVQDGTGSRTLSYGTDWEFASGSAPTLTTTASAQDLLFYYVIATDRVYASLVKAIA